MATIYYKRGSDVIMLTEEPNGSLKERLVEKYELCCAGLWTTRTIA